MTQLFLIIIAVVILMILLSKRGRRELFSRLDTGRDSFVGICEATMESKVRKEERKGRILEMLADGRKVSNAEVRDALGVSRATVVRYLDELELEGRVEQVGRVGHAVIYRLKS